MSTLIILEGPDGVGKTTLSTSLSARLKVPRFKYARQSELFVKGETRIITKYGGDMLLDFIEQVRPSVIFDRLYPSEFAYSIAFGRDFDLDKVLDLDHRYAQLETKIVFCRRSQPYKLYDEEGIQAHHLPAIQLAYNSFMLLTKCERYDLDTAGKSIDTCLDEIVRWVHGSA